MDSYVVGIEYSLLLRCQYFLKIYFSILQNYQIYSTNISDSLCANKAHKALIFQKQFVQQYCECEGHLSGELYDIIALLNVICTIIL